MTAAHCLEPKSNDGPIKKLLSREIIAYFGAYDLKSFELGKFALSPASTVIHEDWNPRSLKYDYDIAVLVFDEKISFTSYIRPICLWQYSYLPENGKVVGWGMNEKETYEPIPKEMNVPIHENAHCFLSNKDLTTLSSERTFCAGYGNGSGVCFGDSGNGLFVRQGNVLYLKGIVSSTLIDRDYKCDVNTFAIFTDVSKHKNWIENIVGHASASSTR